MAEAITYLESDGTSHALTVDGTYRYIEGLGLDEFYAEPVIDELPANINVVRDFNWLTRPVSLRFAVQGSSYANMQANRRSLYQYFVPDITRGTAGTLQFVMDGGGTYQFQAAPRTPARESSANKVSVVSLNFVAPQFLHYLPAGSAGTAFNGTANVNLAFSNAGDVPAYPVFTMTGSVDTARITYPNGNYIEIGTATAGAADVMTVYTKPGLLRIDYELGGTAAVSNWTGYGGTVSTFDTLPTGAGTVVLSAAAGTAALTMTWDALRTGIG